jgi:transposase
MKEESGQYWEEGRQQDAGEDSLERSERSERSGSESSPASRPDGEGPPTERSGGDPVWPPGGDPGGTPGAGADSTQAPEPEVPPLSDEEWEAPWRPREGDDGGAGAEVCDEEDEPTTAPPNLMARRRGTLSKPRRAQMPLSAPQKLLLLDTWQRSGLPARDFAALVNVSHHTLYTWKRRFEQLGPAGLMDQPRGAKRGSRLPELTKRTILMLKAAHPDWGCQRISDMLVRGPALPASPAAVARVLHDAGYQMEEKATRPHPPQVRSFERAKPNQLWQTDLFTFVLKRQNRRVYLVAFMDDHSRFITGYYVLETRALEGMVAACEPRPLGKQPSPQTRIDALEKTAAKPLAGRRADCRVGKGSPG